MKVMRSMGESFRGRKAEEEQEVVPTRGLRSRDKSGTYNAVIWYGGGWSGATVGGEKTRGQGQAERACFL